MTTPIRDALHDATRAEPPLTFSPAGALDKGQTRRRWRQVGGATALTLAICGGVAGAVVALQSPAQKSEVRLPAESPSPLPTATLAQNDGPACGTLDVQMAQITKQELPPVGTWDPVRVASGFCYSDTRSFQVVIHIGDKVATLHAIYFPTPANAGNSASSYSCGPGYAGTPGQPNSPPPPPPGWTCQDRDTSEGHVHSYDVDASKGEAVLQSPVPGEMIVRGADFEDSSGATLVRKNGSEIDVSVYGGPDQKPSSMRPNGTSPYTGAQLADLVVALSQQLND